MLSYTLLTLILMCTSALLMSRVTWRRVKRLETELRMDPLTRIGNRRAFEVAGDQSRHGDVAVLAMIDLDRFKEVNDTHGHHAGDDTLIRVADAMRLVIHGRCRDRGSVYRFGGDEFAILLHDDDLDHARSLVDEIRDVLEGKLQAHERSIKLSVGLAAMPLHTEEWQSLVSFADRALYQAKRSGRNRTVVYSPEQLDLEAARDPLAMLRVLATALGAAVDAKDAYTHAHSHNVADLASYLAREMGLEDSLVDEIFLGGLLHDVGKIGVSDAVLQKPDELTRQEWQEVQTHCEIGYRILNSIEGAERVREMVLSHHERPDGRGYPRGITAEDMPIGARIIAVADAFDSMTADRVYRKAMDPQQALAEIVRQRGIQFYEEAVDAICELMLFEPAHQEDDQPAIAAPDAVPLLPLGGDIQFDRLDDTEDGLDVAA
jgi:diguanylate cyclase (GGDEF)-like protein/putative nucleotidyltransferase with HDIG domain